MKKSLLVVAIFITAVQLQAQNNYKNAIKVNPLSLVFMTGNASYERAISNNQSIQLGGFYTGAKSGDLRYHGYGIVPEVRFYFGKNQKPLNGVYLAPFGRYQNFGVDNKDIKNKVRFTTIGGGAVAGYQKRFESGFILNLFAGPYFNRLRFSNDNAEDVVDIRDSFDGVGLRTGITVGFAF